MSGQFKKLAPMCSHVQSWHVDALTPGGAQEPKLLTACRNFESSQDCAYTVPATIYFVVTSSLLRCPLFQSRYCILVSSVEN